MAYQLDDAAVGVSHEIVTLVTNEMVSNPAKYG